MRGSDRKWGGIGTKTALEEQELQEEKRQEIWDKNFFREIRTA